VTVVELVRQGATVALLILLVLAGAGLVHLLAAGILAGLIALALTMWLARGTVPVLPALDPGRFMPLPEIGATLRGRDTFAHAQP
jgi:hypothetical protein